MWSGFSGFAFRNFFRNLARLCSSRHKNTAQPYDSVVPFHYSVPLFENIQINRISEGFTSRFTFAFFKNAEIAKIFDYCCCRVIAESESIGGLLRFDNMPCRIPFF